MSSDDTPTPTPSATQPTFPDAFSSYPWLRTGNIGVARDGSVWMTAANTMTMVAPAGTVTHPDLVDTQPAAAEATDDESEHHRSRRSRR